VDGAPTGALFNFLSRVRGATARAGKGADPSRCGRDPLSALHRGGFRMRTHEAGSRQWDRSRSDCPRQAVTAWRSGSEPPAVRFAPQPRDATPSSVSRIVSGRRPLLSQDANLIVHIRYVVKLFLRIVVNIPETAAGLPGAMNRTTAIKARASASAVDLKFRRTKADAVEMESVLAATAVCSLPPCGGGLGRGVAVMAQATSANCYPHPQPLPTRGRGAHRACRNCPASNSTGPALVWRI
jgi:hypothetical protein